MDGNTLVAQDDCPSADAARLPWKILLTDPASHLTLPSGGPTRYAYLTNYDYLATFATEPPKGRISITLSLEKNYWKTIMRNFNKLSGLLILSSVVAISAPVLTQAADVNVTFGAPGYYQPTYEQRGYRTQPDWEQESEARRQRAMDWRDHHGNDQYSNRGQDRRDARRAQMNRDHQDNSEHRGHDDNQR